MKTKPLHQFDKYSLYFLLSVLLLIMQVSCAISARGQVSDRGKQLSKQAYKESSLQALHWRNVGPFVGGRVTSVAGVADKPHLFYAVYAGGGVWKTTDSGQNWRNISEKDFKTSAIGAIAVAPSHPKTIYVGAGDKGPRNTLLAAGGGTGGMYKSTDGGETWTRVGLEKTNIISQIVVDPKNPEVVYVAALGHLFAPNPQRGVYKTTDGGKTWKKVLSVDDKTGAFALTMDPSNPQVVYASMWQMSRKPWTFTSGGPGSGIYKTTDGGAHWDDITHNSGLPSGVFGKVGLAVAPSKPNVVYALVEAKVKSGQPGGLFRSEDGGERWTMMNDSLAILTRAFYYMHVYVDPKDPNTVYTLNGGIFVSHDGGETLAELHPPHGDNQALWINPNNPQIFIEGNDEGATVTHNGGKTWSTQYNQPTGQFYSVNLDNQFPFRIYGSQQDNSPSWVGPSAVWRGSIPPAWTEVAGGEEARLVPQPGKPWITYASNFSKTNRRTGMRRDISPWPAKKTYGMAANKVKYRRGWNYSPITFAPNDPNKLLVGANVLLESKDQGMHWKEISPDLTRNDKSKQQRAGGPIIKDVSGQQWYNTLSAIKVSTVDASVMWTGSDDGLVHVTTNGGGDWKKVRPQGLPKWIIITSIEASHTNPGTAWLTASHYMWDDFHPYVYKTTDYGEHWTKITTGLPEGQYAESIVQDPNDPSLLFLGTSNAVYFSQDGGSHWMPLSLNLPPVRVKDIAIQPEQHAVVLATFGRAYWVLDNLPFLEQLSHEQVASDATHLFKPQQTWLVKRSKGKKARVSVRPRGENKPASVTIFFHLPDNYSKDPVKLSFTTAKGKPVHTVTLPKKAKKSKNDSSAFQTEMKKPQKLQPGLNRYQWDLRYSEATSIEGVFDSGFEKGPEVMPGEYYVQLSYGNHTTQKQRFEVKLDPRLKTTKAQLQERFNLLMRIHTAIDSLDIAMNQAKDARRQLKKSVEVGKVPKVRADKAIAALNRDMSSVVNSKIQSFVGALLFEPQLRTWLGSLARAVDMDFVAPTSSQKQVATMHIEQAHVAITRLQSDIESAEALQKR